MEHPFFCTVIFFCFANGRRFPAGTGGSTGYGKQSHRNHPIYRRRANCRQTATGTGQTTGKPAAGAGETADKPQPTQGKPPANRRRRANRRQTATGTRQTGRASGKTPTNPQPAQSKLPANPQPASHRRKANCRQAATDAGQTTGKPPAQGKPPANRRNHQAASICAENRCARFRFYPSRCLANTAGRNKTKQKDFCILVFCIKNGYSRRNTRHRPETQTVIVLQNRYRHRQILLQQPLLPKQTLPYKYRESQTVYCHSPVCYISVGNYPYYRNYTVSRTTP